MKINLRLGRWSKFFALGYGCCLKCRTPWKFVHYHVTRFESGRGCFPLCRKCWKELSPNRRLPYYRELFSRVWDSPRDVEWSAIQTVVLAGG